MDIKGNLIISKAKLFDLWRILTIDTLVVGMGMAIVRRTNI